MNSGSLALSNNSADLLRFASGVGGQGLLPCPAGTSAPTATFVASPSHSTFGGDLVASPGGWSL